MSNLATQNQVQMSTWQEMKEQATVLVKTGFLPESIKTPEQAMAIMLTGKELGIPPMQALRGVNVIKGTPSIKPELMLALCISRIPGFTYEFGTCDKQSATVTVNRPSMTSPYVSTFTMDDAAKAGLTSNPTWGKYPANMLRWRALGNALHVVAPDVLVGIYTPEELGAEVNGDGEVVALPTEPVKIEPIADPATAEQQDKIKKLWKGFGDNKQAHEAAAGILGKPFDKNALSYDEADNLITCFSALLEPAPAIEAEPVEEVAA